MTIQIYTDGSCKGNPGPGGWAAVILINDQQIELTGNDKHTTNNRMEMMAIIQALKYLHDNNLEKNKIEIYSDSNLIIKTINDGWKRKANTDLWALMDKYRAWIDITWTWVKAHADNVMNNRADQLAQKAADKV